MTANESGLMNLVIQSSNEGEGIVKGALKPQKKNLLSNLNCYEVLTLNYLILGRKKSYKLHKTCLRQFVDINILNSQWILQRCIDNFIVISIMERTWWLKIDKKAFSHILIFLTKSLSIQHTVQKCVQKYLIEILLRNTLPYSANSFTNLNH